VTPCEPWRAVHFRISAEHLVDAVLDVGSAHPVRLL
jgi:hypothetical protein